MSLKKESDKHLKMDKKDSSFRKEETKDFTNNSSQSTPTKSSSGSKNLNFKEKAQDGLSKGLTSYQDELQSDDYGIESSGKMSKQSFKTTKATVNKLRNHHQNKRNSQPETESDKQLNSTKSKLGQETSKLNKGSSASAEKVIPSNSGSRNPARPKLKKADEEHFKSVTGKLGKEHNKQKTATSKFRKPNQSGNQKGFMAKVISQPKKIAGTAKSKGVGSFKETLESDDSGVEVGSKGSKLVKDGVKSINHVKRVQSKKSAARKLKAFDSKLKTNSTLRKTSLNPSLKKGQKALLKKRVMRKSIDKGRKTATLSMTKRTGLAVKGGINAIKQFGAVLFKRMMATKVFAWVGALSLKLLPVFAVMGILIGIIVIVMAMAGGGGNEEMNQSVVGGGLDPEVEQWRDLVTEIAEEKGMTKHIELVLAIIQLETGGKSVKDIMQSSESAGHPRNYFQTERESIEQGISHLKNVVNILKGYSESYLKDTKLIAQTYNFGLGFARHVGGNGYDGYSVSISEKYSKDIVAVALGNSTGETYPYVNITSTSLGKPYLYRNGGNYLYGEEIGQYVVDFGDGTIVSPTQPFIINSHFGYRPPDATNGIGSSDHKGIDLHCVGGVTPIKSILGGKVVTSKVVGGLGNAVVVQHDNGLYSTYGHMISLSVAQGQTVGAGQTVGICGSTGDSTGPHLHLEISPVPHSNQVNPYPYLKHLLGG